MSYKNFINAGKKISIVANQYNVRTKESLLCNETLKSLTRFKSCKNIPNIECGNCDFSVSNDPLKNGTLSPNGVWKWNGIDAVWEYQGDSPTSLTYKDIDLVDRR